MTIELVIFDFGPQLVHGGSRSDPIEAAFAWTELGDMDHARLSVEDADADARDLREVRGTSAAFVALRSAGIRTAITAAGSRSAVVGAVKRLGWHSLVDVVVCAEEAGGARPSARLVHAAMARSGVVSPLRVAKVADTPTGLLEGYAGNCDVLIAVHHPGQDDEDDLLLYPHTHRIATASLVPELLRRLGRSPANAESA